MCVSPGCKVCQWPHYARTVGLGSTPGYPPAGNCVPLSCLVLGLFWLFDFFFFFCCCCGFFWFLISSWCRLCWQPMTAEKKISKHKRKKKEGPPQTKGLKKQTNKKKPNPHGEEWRGSYCLGGPWNLLQSMNRSPKRAPLAVLCVSYFCVHFRVQVCLDFDFFF